MTTEHKNELAGELFTVPESLSPKLEWLRKHCLETAFDAGWTADMQESPETGETLHPYSCYRSDLKGEVNFHTAGLGATEEEAILDFCAKHPEVKHWTIETETAP